MAYFSNGTEGMQWDAHNCCVCPLGQEACPIYLAQMHGNYDQYKGEGNQLAMDILNILIPTVDRFPGDCAMRKLLEQKITVSEPPKGLIPLPGFKIVPENGGAVDV